MPDIKLRYGCNPHQAYASIAASGDTLPFRVLNGSPSMINMLDALTAWQLVKELSSVTGRTAAASFKHVSPAGTAIDGEVPDQLVRSQFVEAAPRSSVARAYLRARAADRMSSFGDAAAVSDTVDLELASLLKREVSDLIIAPAYEPEALEVLRQKKKGSYLVLEMDLEFAPAEEVERRDVFGLTIKQDRNGAIIDGDLFQKEHDLPPVVVDTLVVGTVALKYTQSNSVCVAYDGQVIGMAAGQQSRIHCTRLACEKAEKWMLQQHPRVLALPLREDLKRPERTNAVDQYLNWPRLSAPERSAMRGALTVEYAPLADAERSAWFASFSGLCLSSDAFIPFRDNIDRAAHTGIKYVAHAGGSARDGEIRAAAAEHGMEVIETGLRCFTH